MSFLDRVEVGSQLQAKLEVRKRWGTAFDSNHREFAEKLASGIASSFIDELRSALSDPIKTKPIEKDRFIKQISLEIYQSRTAQKLATLAGDGAHLEPFKGWLDHFAKEDKQERHDYYERPDKRIDYRYFDSIMHLVGKIVGQKLNELLATKPPIKDLNTRVILWQPDDDSSFGASSKVGSHSVRLEAWLNEGATEESANGETLSRYQVTRKMKADADSANMKRYVLMGILVIMAIAVYHFGFRNRKI